MGKPRDWWDRSDMAVWWVVSAIVAVMGLVAFVVLDIDEPSRTVAFLVLAVAGGVAFLGFCLWRRRQR